MKRLSAWLILATLALGMVLVLGCQQQSEQPAEETQDMGNQAGEMTEQSGEMMEAPGDSMMKEAGDKMEEGMESAKGEATKDS